MYMIRCSNLDKAKYTGKKATKSTSERRGINTIKMTIYQLFSSTIMFQDEPISQYKSIKDCVPVPNASSEVTDEK